jgi:antitoxin CptB
MEFEPAPGQLIWRCRRGMKELDLLLMRYLKSSWSTACADERATFEAFLELPDPTMASYLVHGELATNPAVSVLVAKLRSEQGE